MGKHCSVKGCNTGINLPSHVFPKDAILLNKWKQAVHSKKIEGLTDKQLRKCVVCYRHFADSDYDELYRIRKLKPGVVPSLCLPNHSNNNNEASSDNNSNKNSSNHRDEDYNQTVTIEHIKLETTMDTVDKMEVEIMDGEPLTQPFANTNNLLNKEPLNFSELKLQESKYSKLTQLERPKRRLQEPTLLESKRSQTESSFSKSSLLELHNLLQEKSFDKFTPKVWNLYKLCSMLKKKQEAITKRQLSFHERMRQARQYSKRSIIQELLSSLTPLQRTYLQMQMKASKYAPKDRSFTLDEKLAALLIMKQSSTCYQYLTQVYNLPSVCILQSILYKINIHPGPITFINQHLKKQVQVMKTERDRVCVLMWSEMLLQPHLDYNARKKHILGFEDLGKMRCAGFADHALVFMVRGIQSGWKLPLAYYFCDGAAKPDQLVEWIKTAAKIIIDSGLHLVALICNDRKENITAVNQLKLESAKLKSKRGQFYHGDITIDKQDIIPLYDPLYLIKGIRDNLLNSDLEFDCGEKQRRKFASWTILERAYYMNLIEYRSAYRLMPKITAEHVIKTRIQKKNIKHAAQIFSMTMSRFIYHHTKLDGYVNTVYGRLRMPRKKGQDTAEMVFFFDQLFDSVNGYILEPDKLLRGVVSRNSSHLEFWQTAIKRLQRMRFVDSKSKSPLRDSAALQNWIYTLRGFRKLWMILTKYGFKYLKPRLLNQHALRHFFREIRCLSKRYNNPTCAEFESSFKTLLINDLSSSSPASSNEAETNGSLLFTLKELAYRVDRRNDNGTTGNLEILDIEMKPFVTTYDHIDICNCIAARILNDSRIKGCDVCKNLLTSSVNSDLISNSHLLKMFKDADDILKQKMSSFCYMHHTALMLETELYMQMDLRWLNCQQHNRSLKELMVSYMVMFYIYKWCEDVNDILTGQHDDPS